MEDIHTERLPMSASPSSSPSPLSPRTLVPINFPDLTAGNHLRWALDGKAFADRTSADQRFGFEIQCRPTLRPWYEELQSGLQQLIEDHGRNLNLFYSGGYDSEIVLRELQRLGAHLKVWTIRFIDGENAFDVGNTIEVCRELGIGDRHHLLNVDIKERMASRKLAEASMYYQCSQVAYLNVLIEAERLYDYPMIMGGEIYMQRHQRPGPNIVEDMDWFYVYREDEDGCTYRFSQLEDKVLINEVFSYTPEMIYSWFKVPTVNDLVNSRIPGKIVMSSMKAQIFKECYPYDLVCSQKRHGFEVLQLQNAALQAKLKADLPTSDVAYVQPHKDITK